MKGKELCEILKSVRKKIAEANGIVYEPHKCNHQGDCLGTCPMCDAELKYLVEELEKKGADANYDFISDEEYRIWFRDLVRYDCIEYDRSKDSEPPRLMGGPIIPEEMIPEEYKKKRDEERRRTHPFPEITLGVIVDPYSDPSRPSKESDDQEDDSSEEMLLGDPTP